MKHDGAGRGLALAIRSEVAQLPERPRNDLAAGWCCPLGLVVIRPGPWVIDCIGASETGGEKRSHQAGGHTLGTRHSWKAFPVGPRSCLRRQMGQSCRWTTSSHPLAGERWRTGAEGGARGVREGGLEPPRPYGHWHLKPARLPIPPLSRGRFIVSPVPDTRYRDRGPTITGEVAPTE
jgi:hypothetical protein